MAGSRVVLSASWWAVLWEAESAALLVSRTAVRTAEILVVLMAEMMAEMMVELMAAWLELKRVKQSAERMVELMVD